MAEPEMRATGGLGVSRRMGTARARLAAAQSHLQWFLPRIDSYTIIQMQHGGLDIRQDTMGTGGAGATTDGQVIRAAVV